jgi:murein DD-endopeptidase MepM/ murein hydrolase activator NlpD
MRRVRAGWLAAALILGVGAPAAAAEPAAGEDVFTPLTAVPFNPTTTPVPGTDGKWHLVYELQLANTRPAPATLKGVQVTDVPEAEAAAESARLGRRGRPAGLLADRGGRPPEVLAEFGAETFPERLRQLDNQPAENAEIGVSAARLFLIDLALARHEPPPAQLRHVLELTGQDGTDFTNPEPVEQHYPAATIQVTRRLPVLRPPLAGTGWLGGDGCCGPGGAHRVTAVPVNGRLHYAERFAIDWVKLDGQGRLRSGPASDVNSYTSYGEKLLAVADGVVVATLDGLPDQVPPNDPDPSTVTLENVAGNHVVLDIGDGFFAFYAHMKPGSVRVRVRQKVRAGAVLGLLGNSGNTRTPHLHFHLMDGPSVLGSEGVPYVLRRFKLAGKIPLAAVAPDFGGDYRRFLLATPQPRSEQLPLDGDVVDFTR